MTRRTRTALASAAALILLAATLLVLLWPHQPVGPPPGPVAERAREEFALKVAPTRGTTSTLITPAGDQWWELVTGLAAPLHLYGTEPPEGATWYGHTTAAAEHSRSTEVDYYHAVYIRFVDAAHARAWVDRANYIGQTVRFAFARGNIATYAPPRVTPSLEPFRTGDKLDRHIPAHVRAASWAIDLSADVKAMAADRRSHAEAYRTLMTHLGIARDGVTWQGTSTRADGTWTGTLTGFDPDTVDLEAFTATIVGTVKSECADGYCLEVDPGLSTLAGAATLTVGERGWGRPYRAVGQVAPAAGSLLYGFVDLVTWESRATENDFLDRPDLMGVQVQLAPDGTLDLTPVFGNGVDPNPPTEEMVPGKQTHPGRPPKHAPSSPLTPGPDDRYPAPEYVETPDPSAPVPTGRATALPDPNAVPEGAPPAQPTSAPPSGAAPTLTVDPD